jgi:hypothetical protein
MPAACRGPYTVFFVNLDHRVAHALADSAQLALLIGGRLVLSAVAGVKDGATHDGLTARAA